MAETDVITGARSEPQNPSRKIFAGPRVRRIRRERGLNQSEMAAELGFSVSYLNLVERNQRPVSAQMLLRLAEVYGVDLASFAGSEDARVMGEVMEILADPLFKDFDIGRAELQDMADLAPQAVAAMRKLYDALRDSRQRATDLSSKMLSEEDVGDSRSSPAAEVREFLQSARNHFPALDEQAEKMVEGLGVDLPDLVGALVARLEDEHGVRVRTLPESVMAGRIRHFDHHRRQLQLSEALTPSSRLFQIAFQIAQFEVREGVEDALRGQSFADEETEGVARRSLMSYVAGAIMMPYGRFLADARAEGYDIDLLARRYGASFEQVAHRLTTLSRPGDKGLPFFFLRVDRAGNISKRFSAGASPFPRFGGTCPLWSVYEAFSVPQRILPQVIEMPGGGRYFTLSRAADRASGRFGARSQMHAIAIGCALEHAGSLVYTRSMDLENAEAVPVGPTCRLCDREACPARAHPRVGR